MLNRCLYLGWGLVFLTACGPNKNVASKVLAMDGGECLTYGTSVVIANNHGHGAPHISVQNLRENSAGPYVLGSGHAGHQHLFYLTGLQLSQLQKNIGIELTTDPDGTGHTHDLIINCQGRPLPQH